MNAGQQCIAPDYVLIERAVTQEFIDSCREIINEFYEGDPKVDGRIGRIVNDRRMDAMVNILTTHAACVVIGGEYDVRTRYVEPTVMLMDGDEDVMLEETFGPILMIKEVSSIHHAVSEVCRRPKPLAMYVFSSSDDTVVSWFVIMCHHRVLSSCVIIAQPGICATEHKCWRCDG